MKGRGPDSSVNSLRCYPRVPFITAIFPIAAAAAMQLGEALHQLDARDVLRHLVAELPLEAQPQRRAVGTVNGLPRGSI